MSTGKIPDAREESAKITEALYAGCCIEQLTENIAAVQKRTLLAAAARFDGTDHVDYHWYEVSDFLERLAQEIGRQG